jgi:membrane protein
MKWLCVYKTPHDKLLKVFGIFKFSKQIQKDGMKQLGKAFRLLGDAVNAFSDDHGFKLSASLSYYMVFALGPLLIIIISLAGIFFGKEAVQGRIYQEINGLVGSEAALQIQDIIMNIQHSQATTAAPLC